MILREKENHTEQGASSTQRLESSSQKLVFSDEGISQSSYVLKGRLLREKRHLLLGIKQTPVEFSAGLFIKTSAKRKSPWRYNFKKEHQDEVRELFNSHGEVFNIFVNEMSGIACLNFEQLKEILEDNHEEQDTKRQFIVNGLILF